MEEYEYKDNGTKYSKVEQIIFDEPIFNSNEAILTLLN